MSLQALKEDKISYKQFATIMLFNSISQKYEEKNYNVVPIFLTDGTLNIEALDAIIQTLFVAGEDSNSDIFRLSPLKLAKWIELMKICPESEKCFFSIPNETVGIISRISEGLEENTFVHYNGLQDQKLRMIPSLSMKQNYLNVLNPKDAITITPKIGLSTLEEIEENGLISTRD